MGDDHGKGTRSRKIVFDRLWYRRTSCLDEALLVGSIGIILPLDYTHCRIRICSLVTSWASCWCLICTAFTLSFLRTNPFATCLLCSKLSSHAKLSLIDYSVSILPANFHGWANMTETCFHFYCKITPALKLNLSLTVPKRLLDFPCVLFASWYLLQLQIQFNKIVPVI